MRKLLYGALCFLCLGGVFAQADETAFYKAGPLELYIPMKTAQVTYLYDFNANQNLVGGETPIASMWNRVEGTVGVVTSLEGQGTPFVGGDLLLGNVLDRWVALPPELKIGGFGGWNFHSETPIYGLKASYKLW